MTLLAVLLGVLLAAQEPESAELEQAQNAVLRRMMLREVYSGIVRDGMRSMRIEPLPFTKRLPAGAPDFDAWEATGYEKDVVAAADNEALVTLAVRAGICAEGELPCAFSFVYLFAVQKYFSGKPDEVGIRYIIRKRGKPTVEGVIWGTEQKPFHWLRDGASWLRVEDRDGCIRMNAAVQIAHGVHRFDLKELSDAGRIEILR